MGLYQKIGNQIKKWDFVDKNYLVDQKYVRGYPVIYLGGENANDDDIPGRGLSPELPYATLDFVRQKVGETYVGLIYVRLQGEIQISSDITLWKNDWLIQSHDFEKECKITLSGGNITVCDYGNVTIDHVNIDTNENWIAVHQHGRMNMRRCNVTSTGEYVFTANSNGSINFNYDMSISGNADQFFRATNNSDIIINCAPMSINGSVSGEVVHCSENSSFTIIGEITTEGVTGKRYEVANASGLVVYRRGPNLIPGTIEGKCDETSIYI